MIAKPNIINIYSFEILIPYISIVEFTKNTRNTFWENNGKNISNYWVYFNRI